MLQKPRQLEVVVRMYDNCGYGPSNNHCFTFGLKQAFSYGKPGSISCIWYSKQCWLNIRLIFKRLRIVELLEDVISLIEMWLSDWSYFVVVDGVSSCVVDLTHGTIQGSILGPILYVIYISLSFDLLIFLTLPMTTLPFSGVTQFQNSLKSCREHSKSL